MGEGVAVVLVLAVVTRKMCSECGEYGCWSLNGVQLCDSCLFEYLRSVSKAARSGPGRKPVTA
jgi:hypothetical protein